MQLEVSSVGLLRSLGSLSFLGLCILLHLSSLADIGIDISQVGDVGKGGIGKEVCQIVISSDGLLNVGRLNSLHAVFFTDIPRKLENFSAEVFDTSSHGHRSSGASSRSVLLLSQHSSESSYWEKNLSFFLLGH